MHRVSIIYRNRPAATFDMKAYLSDHLPAALRTTSEHVPVRACEVDRPADTEAPYRCLCTLYFDDAIATDGFRTFLAGEASEEIRANVATFTDIKPDLIVGDVIELVPGETAEARLRILYPRGDDTYFDADYYINTHMPLAGEATEGAAKIVSIDADFPRQSLDDAAPAYHCLLTLNTAALSDAEALLEAITGPAGEAAVADIPNYTNSQPDFVISEVITVTAPETRQT